MIGMEGLVVRLAGADQSRSFQSSLLSLPGFSLFLFVTLVCILFPFRLLLFNDLYDDIDYNSFSVPSIDTRQLLAKYKSSTLISYCKKNPWLHAVFYSYSFLSWGL